MGKYRVNYRWIFGVVLLIFCSEVEGQNYLLANKPQLNQKKSLYHLPIGENNYGTYTMNYISMYLKDGFSIEWYDSDFGIQEDRFIEVSKKSWVLRVWTTDSMVCWVTATKKRSQGFVLNLNQLSYNLKGEIQTKLIGIMPIKEINSDDVIVRNHLIDHSFIIGFIKKEKRGTSVNFMKFSDQGNWQEHLSKTLSYDVSTLYWEDLEFATVSGDYYMGLLHLTKPRDVAKGFRQTIYLAIGKNKESVSLQKQNDSLFIYETQSDVYLQHPVLSYNPVCSCWTVAGLWGNIKSESLGYWVWEILNGVSGVGVMRDERQNFFLHEYNINTAKILDGVIKRKKKVAPENYIARKMIFQADGAVVLILERFIELKQLETYYINGIPQTATKILYNYNEIGLLYLNRKMSIDTCLRVDKEQASSPNNAYLLGFGSYVCETGIHILYNADISKNNEVVDIIIRPNYEIQSRTLINSDHTYSVLVPMDGKETNYCSFTVPLLKDKQWFWMKVFDYDK